MEPLLFLAAFATAVLSATMGMAGGMLLMGGFLAWMPVPEAMVLHGLTQLVANGSRAALLHRHVHRRALVGYAAGASAAWAVFHSVHWTPPVAVVYLGIGAIPFLARAAHLRADITRGPVAVVCGTAVGAAQLCFGVAGPLLDVFFLDAPLDRRAVVGTKAVTQTLAHVLKVCAFLPSVTAMDGGAAATCMIAAGLGTLAGNELLTRMSDARFKQVTSAVVLTMGAGFLVRGGMAWLAGGASGASRVEELVPAATTWAAKCQSTEGFLPFARRRTHQPPAPQPPAPQPPAPQIPAVRNPPSSPRLPASPSRDSSVPEPGR